MKDVVQAIARADLPKKPFVIVGGAPLTETFAQSIGADGFAPDASRAVSVVKALLS
jgi:5-methyltetrahydrofolate--homocysteine methyltransferase